MGRLIPTLLSKGQEGVLSVTCVDNVTFDDAVPPESTSAVHKVYLAAVQNNVNTAFSSALVKAGFLDKLTEYVAKGSPDSPPPSTEALHEDDSPDLVEPRKSELQGVWKRYASRPHLLSVLKAFVEMSSSPDARDRLGRGGLGVDKCMKVIFQISNAAGMGDVGIEAEKVIEKCKELTKVLDDKLRERKKILSQRRREKAMMSMKKLSSPKDQSATEGKAKESVKSKAVKEAVEAADKAVKETTTTKEIKGGGLQKIETPAWMLEEMAGMDEEVRWTNVRSDIYNT
jgi:hypothetical protein